MLSAAALAVIGASTVVSAGSINDIEHVVFFMQENRPFDHYYGRLKGVRGFADRTAPQTPGMLCKCVCM